MRGMQLLDKIKAVAASVFRKKKPRGQGQVERIHTEVEPPDEWKVEWFHTEIEPNELFKNYPFLAGRFEEIAGSFRDCKSLPIHYATVRVEDFTNVFQHCKGPAGDLMKSGVADKKPGFFISDEKFEGGRPSLVVWRFVKKMTKE